MFEANPLIMLDMLYKMLNADSATFRVRQEESRMNECDDKSQPNTTVC